MFRWYLGALALLWASSATGEESPNDGLRFLSEEPVTIGQRIQMRSQILGTKVEMKIWVPESFAISSDAHTYPVLFVNGEHGNQFFPALVGIVKHLGDRERIPESIVVSLTDLGEIPKIYTHGMWERETLGGAEDPEVSIRHLEQEVIPFLEREYRANRYRMMIGVSGSCLFPIHLFNRRPDLITGQVWVAAADVIGMGYTLDSDFIDTFEKSFAAHPKLESKIYLGVAESDLQGKPEYRANLDEITARLARFSGLDLEVEVVAGADHYTVLIDAVLAALEQNFPPSRWSSRYRDLVAQPGNALENIDRYYRELSREYGFEILPRADRWNNVNSLRFMTRHLIREERADEALQVARRRIEYRPRSAGAHSGLADALEAVGDLEAAIEAQRRALDLAREWKAGEETLAGLEERLRGLQEAAK